MKKYLIVGGCSYAHKNLNKVLDIIGFDIETVHVNTSASSNRYISESIMLVCNLLLDSGVASENIIVLNNFTQIGRANPIIPTPLKPKIKESLLATEHRSFKNNQYYTFYNSFVSVLGRVYYLLIGYGGKSPSVQSWIDKQENYYSNVKPPIAHFEEYLTEIILMQRYLKDKNIFHISYMMNNVFEGWDLNLSHCYTNFRKWELPSMKGYRHISELSSMTKILWDMVDLDTMCFYQTKNNKFGGIDEYFVDKFNDIKYLHDFSEDNYTFYGNHPNEEIYGSFTEKYIKPKLLKWKAQHIL